MKKTYIIEGMTCEGCVASVKEGLEKIDSIKEAIVSLEPPQATIIYDRLVDIDILQESIGHYQIKDSIHSSAENADIDLPDISLSTYKPLLIIIGFICGVSLLTQYPFDEISWMLWMRYFMAGFFLVFSFFKLLNLQGFANSYQMYDIIAGKWKNWGYIYPFVELILGILYLINVYPFATNIITMLVLGVSSIGVIKSNMNNRKIKCACLGDVFNLPMSTVTIVEDVTMVVMAGIMLTVMT